MTWIDLRSARMEGSHTCRLGFPLRLATPGCSVGVCVCLCARSVSTPPLLGGVCGVGVCAWARVSAAPRHSWLGCWDVCVFLCALRLYLAPPCGGLRCGCVCLGLGCGCASPLLAGVLVCVCACLRARLVPRHSWLVCAVWVGVFGLWFQLGPAAPGWGVGVGVCLCVRSACTPPLVAGLCSAFCFCAWARVAAAPCLSWLGCWGVCVFVCALRLYPATPGSGVRCGCGCLGSGFGCCPPLLAGMLACLCVCVRTPLVPRLSWLGCAVWVCACLRARLVPRHSWLVCAVWVGVFGLWFRLGPAAPGWGVGVGVCLCVRSACTPPLVAGLCSAFFFCAWARVAAAPCLSWLGCWGVCVFTCALRLYPATPGSGVRCGCGCLGSGFGCCPPLLDGMLACLCVCVRTPLVPRLSWLGCAVWVCVLGLGFRLPPATPGWGFGVCVCLCARSACTPALLAGVCGVGVCAWAPFSAAARHSWLGCWGACLFVCALRLYPASPGWGVRCGCVCLGSGFGCAPPLLAGVLGCVCVCVASPLGPPPLLAGVCGVGVCAWARVSAAPRHSWLGCWGVCVFLYALRLYPTTPGLGVRCGCVCLGSGFGCAPPLLAGVLGCVCVCVRSPLVPRHSWLECAVSVCVLGLRFRLRPATPDWGVGVCVCVFVCALRLYPATPGSGVRCGCVCSGSGFGCTPPLLAGVMGCVCVFMCALGLCPTTPGWGMRCVGWV